MEWSFEESFLGYPLTKFSFNNPRFWFRWSLKKNFFEILTWLDLDSHWKNVLESFGLLLWWFLRRYFLIIQQCCWNDHWKNIPFKILGYDWKVFCKIFLKNFLKKMSLKIKIYDLKGPLTKYSLKYSFLGLNHP